MALPGGSKLQATMPQAETPQPTETVLRQMICTDGCGDGMGTGRAGVRAGLKCMPRYESGQHTIGCSASKEPPGLLQAAAAVGVSGATLPSRTSCIAMK